MKILHTAKKAFQRIPRGVWRGLLTLALTAALCIGALGAAVMTVSLGMKDISADKILSLSEALLAIESGDYDCILVLGAGVRPDGTPSHMLEDRLLVGCELYTGDTPLLMSGDHTGDYNEVGTMRDYALLQGVPAENIFLDHEGYSTYESIYRAKKKFGAKRIVIISQGYHLHRALFIARELGIEAVGVPSDLRDYYLQTRYELREILARFKDFYVSMRGGRTYDVGASVDLSGDGSLT